MSVFFLWEVINMSMKLILDNKGSKIILPDTEEEIGAYSLKIEDSEEDLTEADKQTLETFDEITSKFRSELIEQMKKKNKVTKVEETKLNE